AEAKSETGLSLSSNDLLTAWLAKNYGANSINGAEELLLTCALDYRRIHPDLSQLFFGNAVQCAIARFDREEINEINLGMLAKRIRDSVDAIDLPAIKDTLLCLEELRTAYGLRVIEECHVTHPESGFFVTNMSRIPVSELDFGSGSPNG